MRKSEHKMAGKDKPRELLLHSFRTDIVQSFRFIAKNRRFSLPVLIILALGMFACTVVFSIYNAVVLQALPYPQPDSLVSIVGTSKTSGLAEFPLSRSQVEQVQDDADVFESVAYYAADPPKYLTYHGYSDRIWDVQVSAGFFRVLRVEALLGRLLTPEDFQPGKDCTIVLGFAIWQQRFSGDRNIVGTSAQMEGRSCTIVGVMPPQFRFPSMTTQLWMADTVTPVQDDRLHDKWTIGRLKKYRNLEVARAELAAISRRVGPNQSFRGTMPDFAFSAVSLADRVIGPTKKIMILMLLAVLMVQLIACANVANLLLARNANRRKEFAVRLALGSGRAHILQQVITESLLLALIGGTGGIAAAFWGVRIAHRVVSTSLNNSGPVTIDFRVLSASLLLSVVSGLFFGTIPALRATKLDLIGDLKAGASEGRRGFIAGGNRLQSVLAVSQITLALVLLVGFGLLARGLLNLVNTDFGFDPKHLVTVQLNNSGLAYPKLNAILSRMISDLGRLPFVQSSAVSTFRPLIGTNISTRFAVDDPRWGWTSTSSVEYQSVSSDYFRAMRIPILEGRPFTELDRDGSPCVAVVSSAAAHLYWPGTNAVGSRIDLNGGLGIKPYYCEIVGVVGDVRDVRTDAAPQPAVYFSYLQSTLCDIHSVILRVSGSAEGLTSAILKTVKSIDPSQVGIGVDNLDEVIDSTTYQPRIRITVLGLFAVSAVLLAVVGLYGVISYSVSQRVREMGIRMALGARPIDVVSLVLRHCSFLIAVGLAAGLCGSVALSHAMVNMLYEVKPTDTLTYVSAAVLLTAVSFVASYIPARRASAVIPSALLREE